MWLIQNQTIKQFFEGWTTEESYSTTDSKAFAAHFSSWEQAAEELKHLPKNFIVIPKEEA